MVGFVKEVKVISIELFAAMSALSRITTSKMLFTESISVQVAFPKPALFTFTSQFPLYPWVPIYIGISKSNLGFVPSGSDVTMVKM